MTPYWDPQARGCLWATGAHGRPHYRSLLEGIALEQALVNRHWWKGRPNAAITEFSRCGGRRQWLVAANRRGASGKTVRSPNREASVWGGDLRGGGRGWFPTRRRREAMCGKSTLRRIQSAPRRLRPNSAGDLSGTFRMQRDTFAKAAQFAQRSVSGFPVSRLYDWTNTSYRGGWTSVRGGSRPGWLIRRAKRTFLASSNGARGLQSRRHRKGNDPPRPKADRWGWRTANLPHGRWPSSTSGDYRAAEGPPDGKYIEVTAITPTPLG